ncbi:MAG TPA: hypothetical protein VM925_33230 [Labilithrix sp.]|nr:hypothetical protein [Labilithrix sp.]
MTKTCDACFKDGLACGASSECCTGTCNSSGKCGRLKAGEPCEEEDCDDGYCSHGVCVANCHGDSDCTDPQKPYCYEYGWARSCSARCTKERHCAGSPNGEVCGILVGLRGGADGCGCKTSYDCPDGMKCPRYLGAWASGPSVCILAECTEDFDCARSPHGKKCVDRRCTGAHP